MGSPAKKSFDAVSIGDKWGVADATGFHQNESHQYAPPGGYPFSVCRIDGLQVAVLIEMAIPVEARAEFASRKPDWLNAVVHGKVVADPVAEVAVIEAEVLNPHDADLHTCAFATACVAFNLGLFKVVPKSYVVRFEGRASVRVSMEYDDDAESWLGEAASEPSLVNSPLANESANFATG